MIANVYSEHSHLALITEGLEFDGEFWKLLESINGQKTMAEAEKLILEYPHADPDFRVSWFDWEFMLLPKNPPVNYTDWDNWIAYVMVRATDRYWTHLYHGPSHISVPGPWLPLDLVPAGSVNAYCQSCLSHFALRSQAPERFDSIEHHPSE